MAITLNRFFLLYPGRQKLINNYRNKIEDPSGYLWKELLCCQGSCPD